MTVSQIWKGRAQAFALALAGVALVAVSAAARQPDQTTRAPGMRGAMPFAHLNLTEDQQSRVKAVLDEQRTMGQAEREALRTAHDQLRTTIFAATAPEAGQVDALIARIAELEADALRARVATQLKIAAILTPEQRQELATAKPPRGRGPGRRPGGPANPGR